MNPKYTWDEIKKSSKTRDGIFALFIYRKIAFVFTYFFVNVVNASPNHVTTFALISWLSSAILIWYNYSILPAILIFCGFVLDCTDGNIARLKKQVSAKGKMYDLIVDRVAYSSILIVLAVKVSNTYSAHYVVVYAVLLLALMIIFDVTKRHIEKVTSSDIHDTIMISRFELIIKAKFKKIIPFVNWNNVIIGIGADLEWTFLMIASIFPVTFPFFLALLFVLIAGGFCAIIFACK